MKEDKEIEKILLNDVNYDKFINSKAEKEFEDVIKNASIKSNQTITDIKKVPKECLFSKGAVYLVINKESKTKSYINGIQADAMLGSQKIAREKLISASVDSFVNGNNFVKFYKYQA